MIEFNEDGTVISDTTLTVYHYDRATGELTGSQEEFLPEGTGLPAYSTHVEPGEEREGFVQVWSGRWTYIEDLRRTKVWDTQTKATSKVDYVGPIKDGFTTLEPAQYDTWVGNAWVHDQVAQDEATSGANTEEKIRRNAEASHWVSVLTDATDPDIMGDDINPEDVTNLKLWKAYRVQLSRVTDMLNPVWPKQPNA